MKEPGLLFTKEEEFGAALARALNDSETFDYRMNPVATEEEALKALASGRTALLLIDEECVTEAIEKSFPEKTVLLLSGERTGSDSSVPGVFRYQKRDALVSALGKALSGPREKTENHQAIYGFVDYASPENGETASLTAALLLAKRRKTVFLSLQPFSALAERMGAEGKFDLSDLMYAVSTGADGEKPHLPLIRFGTLDVVLPCVVPEDSFSLTKDMAERCFAMLRDAMKYEAAIVDFSGNVSLLSAFPKSGSRLFAVRNARDPVPDSFVSWCGRTTDGTAEEVVLPDTRAIRGEAKLSPETLLFSEWASVLKPLVSEGETYD